MFGDGSWLGHRTEAQQERFSQWLAELAERSATLAVIELGAGQAVPTVRRTSERVLQGIAGTLLRINPREASAAASHVGLPLGAAEGLRLICDCATSLQAHRVDSFCSGSKS